MAENGRLPKGQLARVYHPELDLYLSKEAAAAWNTLRMASKRVLRIDLYPGGPDSAYRTLAKQKYWRDYWCGQGQCGNAAVPGSSNHGLGLAIDLPTRGMRFAVDRLGARFGYSKKTSDAPQEWWHIKYAGGFHRPDPGVDIGNPVVRKGSGGFGQSWAVKAAQKHLIRHGLLPKNTKLTGDFGPVTEAAVKKFQKANKLKADGVVGAATWAALRKK